MGGTEVADGGGPRPLILLALSLFPGIDGLGAAFQGEWPDLCIVRGPDVIFGSEWDIRTFHPPAGVFCGLWGGPPCQTFSPLSRLVRAQGKEPRFGNLIPEFERCVLEAQPDWWVMEQVPQAPEPTVPGYLVHHQVVNNAWFAGEDGIGAEQHRKRRISFGTRDGRPLHLEPAALCAVVKVMAVHGGDLTPSERDRARAVAVRSGKVKITSVTSSGIREGQISVKARAAIAGSVTSSDGAASVRMARYTVEEVAELQGFPADFLKDSPFTQGGRRTAIANAVPRPLGRAVARAVRVAMGLPLRSAQVGGGGAEREAAG